MNEKTFEDIFSNYNPSLSDETSFLSALEQRLDSVEYIKQYQDAQIRRYRLMMIVALVFGIFIGIAASFLILALPANISLYTFGFKSAIFVWVEQNFRICSLLPVSALVCWMVVECVRLISEFNPTELSKKMITSTF